MAEREELVAAIRARPFEFVGQEQVALSTVPMWLNDKLEARRVSVRAYVATNGTSFTVMPGGLTRVSPAAGDPVVSMQSGGGSKDTWVLSDGAVSPVSLLTPSGQPVSIARAAGGLPSRVADNLYWLGRYAERLEDTLRVLRCIIVRMADEASSEKSPELASLAQILVHLKLLPKKFAGRVLLKDLEQEILQMIYNPQRTGSMRALVLRIRIIASIVRDRFSTDTWRLLNELQLDARTKRGHIPLADALALLNTLIMDLAAFSGLEMENMTRGHGWRFLDFGRRLERGANLVGVVRAALSPEIKTEIVLESLLEIADSAMTYRRRYFAQARLAPVLDLLLVDASNPRSLAFQLGALTEHAANLPRDPRAPPVLAEQRRLEHLTATLRDADLPALARAREEGDAAAMSGWLDEFLAGLSALSDELTHFYFTLTVARVS